MLDAGIRGRMLYLTSLHSATPRNLPHYATAKAGMVMLVKELAKLHGELKSGRVAMDSKQLLLKTGESKIAELKVKLNQANTNREYQALRDQIAADEMANSVLADEILEAMEKQDGLKAHVPEHEARVAKAKEELAKAQQKVRSEEDMLQSETKRLEGELVAATRTRYSLRRSDARAGTVHVHFPRVGYEISKARD
jgi:chromosome segregation ATPase